MSGLTLEVAFHSLTLKFLVSSLHFWSLKALLIVLLFSSLLTPTWALRLLTLTSVYPFPCRTPWHLIGTSAVLPLACCQAQLHSHWRTQSIRFAVLFLIVVGIWSSLFLWVLTSLTPQERFLCFSAFLQIPWLRLLSYSISHSTQFKAHQLCFLGTLAHLRMLLPFPHAPLSSLA